MNMPGTQCHQFQIPTSASPLSRTTLFPKTSSLVDKCGWFIVPTQPRRPCKCNARLSGGGRSLRVRAVSGYKEDQATIQPSQANTRVKGYVYVQDDAADAAADLEGLRLLIQLVSTELDPSTGSEKKPVEDYARRIGKEGDQVECECEFDLPEDFGPVGAVLVQSQHDRELFLERIDIQLPTGTETLACKSWIQPKEVDSTMRIFFSSKSYLPCKTPEGLKTLRRHELENLRGMRRAKGEKEFKSFERIYDYDTYNDLGDPDTDDSLKRPVLGGKELPYPRRCKTGREHSEKDQRMEKLDDRPVYVPRDEEFSKIKAETFQALTNFQSVVPILQSIFQDSNEGFPDFKAIDMMFSDGVTEPRVQILKDSLPIGVSLQLESPGLIKGDQFSWLRDEEFARQTLAGGNPFSIQLVREWPLRSKLDPKIYGQPESLITTELVEKLIGGFMTVPEAVKQKKLFMLDYHDIFLPYVNKIRGLEGTTMYASRTLLFLNDDDMLRPVAIELTRPPNGEKPQWRGVFTPGYDSTSVWLWMLAKAHVMAHDSYYQQIIVHWMRCHSCMEPYVIAANRQMSAMHPIYRLLHPHFRYTIKINAVARQGLINAGAFIESSYSPGKYSMEISSVIYGQLWRFDKEGLPADLIRRGMAEEDPTAEYGLKLAIKDYPLANDGLILWDAIKQWVKDYVSYYYPDPSLVESDTELQAWWDEVRNKGHGDKKDESWWPVLKTEDDMIQVLTTMIWVASGHHAAVNFGMYTYGGYVPNRPTIARRNMPTEEVFTAEEYKEFLESPQLTLLKTFPSRIQALTAMNTLHLISGHSPDEEYIGAERGSSWGAEAIDRAFEKFKARLESLDDAVNRRNSDLKLKNRCGAGIVKYEVFRPFSESGVTGRGVPNSVTS